jgi:hypothetical protein
MKSEEWQRLTHGGWGGKDKKKMEVEERIEKKLESSINVNNVIT